MNNHPPGEVTLKPGDILNGHVLTADGTWVATQPAPQALHRPAVRPGRQRGVQSLVVGILSVILFPAAIILGPIGVALGATSLRQSAAARLPGTAPIPNGAGQAGIILSALGLIGAIASIVQGMP